LLDRIIESHRPDFADLSDDRTGRPGCVAAAASGGSLMRWLHRRGYLSYACFAFTKA
jgi:hypothetical protein